MGPNFAFRSFFLMGILLGNSYPKPCICKMEHIALIRSINRFTNTAQNSLYF